MNTGARGMQPRNIWILIQLRVQVLIFLVHNHSRYAKGFAQIGTITLDNASNNDTLVDEVARQLGIVNFLSDPWY